MSSKSILSKAQKKYILVINKISLTGSTLTEIAESAGVSKPTALAALNGLIELDIVKKIEEENQSEYTLTAEGMKIAELLGKDLNIMRQVFVKLLAMDADLVESELFDLCTSLSRTFLADAEKQILNVKSTFGYRTTNELERNSKRILDPGVYEVPFKIAKMDSERKSMGNKGFEHPAQVELDENGGRVLLTAKQFYYKSNSIGKTLKGSLMKFYYLTEDGFVQSEERITSEGKHIYSIPIRALNIQRERGISGSVVIKAVATTAHMGKADAKLYLNFSAAKRISDKMVLGL